MHALMRATTLMLRRAQRILPPLFRLPLVLRLSQPDMLHGSPQVLGPLAAPHDPPRRPQQVRWHDVAQESLSDELGCESAAARIGRKKSALGRCHMETEKRHITWSLCTHHAPTRDANKG